MLEYICTGCPRSGTLHMAKLLTYAGIPCGHEKIFGWNKLDDNKWNSNSGISKIFGLKEQNVIADASYMAVPFIQNRKRAKIIHVTRHPFKVIHSILCNLCYFRYKQFPQDKYEQFIAQHVPGLAGVKDPIDKAVLFYLTWNKAIIRRARRCAEYYHHAIEDDTKDLFKWLEVPSQENYYNEDCNAWEKWPTYNNTLAYDDVTPEAILDSKYAKPLIKFMKIYDYSTEETITTTDELMGKDKVERMKGIWKHKTEKGKSIPIMFYETGRVGSPNSPNTWQLEDNCLTIRWIENFTTDECILKGDKYEGTNNFGEEIIGVKI